MTVEACDETNSNNSFIYCNGKLINAINLLFIYKDSKTFVDKPLKFDPKRVKNDFEKKFPENVFNINIKDLRNFIDDNFDEEGTELEKFVFFKFYFFNFFKF